MAETQSLEHSKAGSSQDYPVKHMHQSFVSICVQCLCPAGCARVSMKSHEWEQPTGCAVGSDAGMKGWGMGTRTADITVITCCNERDCRGECLPGSDSQLITGRSFPLAFPLTSVFLFHSFYSILFLLFLIPSVTLKLVYISSPPDPTNKTLCIKPVSISFMQHIFKLSATQ